MPDETTHQAPLISEKDLTNYRAIQSEIARIQDENKLITQQLQQTQKELERAMRQLHKLKERPSYKIAAPLRSIEKLLGLSPFQSK